MEFQTPEVGMKATQCYYTDRRVFIITRVSKSGKTFWMHRDSGLSDTRVSLRKDGKWRSASGIVLPGVNAPYDDPSF